MSGIQFVPQTGTKEDDRDMRKTIRRHVMLGKNLGKVPNIRQPKQDGFAVFRADDLKDVRRKSSSSTIPGRVGSDMSFLEFADAVEEPLMMDTLQFCSGMHEILFGLEPYISFKLADSAASCVQSLVDDALLMNVMVFGSQLYRNAIFLQTTSRQRENPKKAIMQHYGKTLSLLRERVADTESQSGELSNSIIVTIMTLSMHALWAGEVESARDHVTGLSRLVRTKENGIYFFTNDTKLMIEMLRCDISVALATGRGPLFFSDPSETIFPLPNVTTQNALPYHCSITGNSELSQLWDVLSHFCAMISEAATEQKKLPDQILLDTLASVSYRLLHMVSIPSLVDEVTRLAMLAFCASALLSWCQLRLPAGWLQSEYERAITNLMQLRGGLLDPRLVLWFLTTQAIAFAPFMKDDNKDVHSWLIEAMDVCGLTSWDEVYNVVKEFLWIDSICHRPAQELVRDALAGRAAFINDINDPNQTTSSRSAQQDV